MIRLRGAWVEIDLKVRKGKVAVSLMQRIWNKSTITIRALEIGSKSASGRSQSMDWLMYQKSRQVQMP